MIEDIWGVVENGCRRAEALMGIGLYREARSEILTAIVAALIRIRIRCSYNLLSTDVCSRLESSLNHVIKTCCPPGLSEVVGSFLGVRRALNITTGSEVGVEEVPTEA
ncbi:MAG: hypothetical protein RMI45_02895 [Ignisphaera sp.]|nr:hypothetical protein [Ignisphaera sp.]MDW8085172.1 hypothetical protein [Ignisphaera sp.]